MIKLFSLKVEDKIKLLELMIIVGGILGAFKLQGAMLTYYILFLLFSLFYFISLRSEKGFLCKNKFTRFFSTFLISVGFSGVLSLILQESLKSYQSLEFATITSIIYLVFSTVIFFFALYE